MKRASVVSIALILSCVLLTSACSQGSDNQTTAIADTLSAEDYVEAMEASGIIFNGTPKRLRRLNAVPNNASGSDTNSSLSAIAAAYAELDKSRPTESDYEKYSEDESAVDWNEKALEWAKYRLNDGDGGDVSFILAHSLSPITRSELLSDMESEGFASENIDYAISNLTTNLNEQALRVVNVVMDKYGFITPNTLADSFSDTELNYAWNALNIDWNVQAVTCAKWLIKESEYKATKVEVKLKLEDAGFTSEQVEYALNEVGF